MDSAKIFSEKGWNIRKVSLDKNSPRKTIFKLRLQRRRSKICFMVKQPTVVIAKNKEGRSVAAAQGSSPEDAALFTRLLIYLSRRFISEGSIPKPQDLDYTEVKESKKGQ